MYSYVDFNFNRKSMYTYDIYQTPDYQDVLKVFCKISNKIYVYLFVIIVLVYYNLWRTMYKIHVFARRKYVKYLSRFKDIETIAADSGKLHKPLDFKWSIKVKLL